MIPDDDVVSALPNSKSSNCARFPGDAWIIIIIIIITRKQS